MVKHIYAEVKGILNHQHLAAPRGVRAVLESKPPIKLKIIAF